MFSFVQVLLNLLRNNVLGSRHGLGLIACNNEAVPWFRRDILEEWHEAQQVHILFTANDTPKLATLEHFLHKLDRNCRAAKDIVCAIRQ